jgi:hypothetical protein
VIGPTPYSRSTSSLGPRMCRAVHTSCRYTSSIWASVASTINTAAATWVRPAGDSCSAATFANVCRPIGVLSSVHTEAPWWNSTAWIRCTHAV